MLSPKRGIHSVTEGSATVCAVRSKSLGRESRVARPAVPKVCEPGIPESHIGFVAYDSEILADVLVSGAAMIKIDGKSRVAYGSPSSESLVAG